MHEGGRYEPTWVQGFGRQLTSLRGWMVVNYVDAEQKWKVGETEGRENTLVLLWFVFEDILRIRITSVA